MSEATRRSERRKTRSTSSCSSSSKTPALVPSSSIIRTSSSVTGDSDGAFAPTSRSTSSVEAERSATAGADMTESICMGRATRSAIGSGFASAIRFGTISPTTRVRYVITSTTTAKAIVDAYGARTGIRATNTARLAAKTAPPYAPERTPITVIPI